MINKPKEIPYEASADVIAEPKFDGMRGIIRSSDSGFDIFSERNEKQTLKTLQFPEIIPVLPEDTIIDGEICIPLSDYSSDFELMQKRMNLQNKQTINYLATKNPCKFMAFDILKLRGRDLTSLSYKDRRVILSDLVELTEHKNLELVQVGTPFDMWNKVIEKDGEGIVLKKLRGNYYDQWIKRKNWKEFDFKVSGVEERSTNWVLNLVDEDNKDVGKVTLTGYKRTDDLKTKLIGMTAVVKCLGFGNKVRIPILKELRA